MGADTTNEAAMPAGPEEPRRERQRKRRHWLVTIGGLPSRRAYKYVPAFRKIALVQEPCALPPADPDVFPRKRDAMRAMRRTIAFNMRLKFRDWDRRFCHSEISRWSR